MKAHIFVLASVFALVFVGGYLYLQARTPTTFPTFPTSYYSKASSLSLPKIDVVMFKDCDAYNELRDVDFLQPRLRSNICDGSVLYNIESDNRFKLCELKSQLPTGFYKTVNKTARIASVRRAIDGRKPISVFTFSEQDLISREMLQKHDWESGHIREMLSYLRKFSTDSVTFLDIGSNLGLYSVQAREEGYPVLALDANIRTLIRLQMTAKSMGILDDKLKLFWCFLDEEVAIKRMNWVALTHACHIGGASSGSTSWKFANPRMDTIPVMTARVDDLRPYIKTKKVIVKMDIESGEHMFMKTGVKLFEEFDVIVLQMEFWRQPGQAPSTSPFFKFITDFMTSRNYSLVTMASEGNRVQEISKFGSWDGLWIRKDYLSRMLNKTD